MSCVHSPRGEDGRVDIVHEGSGHGRSWRFMKQAAARSYRRKMLRVVLAVAAVPGGMVHK